MSLFADKIEDSTFVRGFDGQVYTYLRILLSSETAVNFSKWQIEFIPGFLQKHAVPQLERDAILSLMAKIDETFRVFELAATSHAVLERQLVAGQHLRQVNRLLYKLGLDGQYKENHVLMWLTMPNTEGEPAEIFRRMDVPPPFEDAYHFFDLSMNAVRKHESDFNQLFSFHIRNEIEDTGGLEAIQYEMNAYARQFINVIQNLLEDPNHIRATDNELEISRGVQTALLAAYDKFAQLPVSQQTSILSLDMRAASVPRRQKTAINHVLRNLPRLSCFDAAG